MVAFKDTTVATITIATSSPCQCTYRNSVQPLEITCYTVVMMNWYYIRKTKVLKRSWLCYFRHPVFTVLGSQKTSQNSWSQLSLRQVSLIIVCFYFAQHVAYMFQATSDCATLHHTRRNFCRATSRATKVAPCMVALMQLRNENVVISLWMVLLNPSQSTIEFSELIWSTQWLHLLLTRTRNNRETIMYHRAEMGQALHVHRLWQSLCWCTWWLTAGWTVLTL